MVERIKALEKDLTLQEPLGDMKEIFGPTSLIPSMMFGLLFRLFLNKQN